MMTVIQVVVKTLSHYPNQKLTQILSYPQLSYRLKYHVTLVWIQKVRVNNYKIKLYDNYVHII